MFSMVKVLGASALSTFLLGTVWAAALPLSGDGAEHALRLMPCRVPAVPEELRCGTFQVYENRDLNRGRMLPLKVVLIPAREPRPEDGPIFYFGGGPGTTNTEGAKYIARSSLRQFHDLVLVDFRGTGDGHRLDCDPLPPGDERRAKVQTPFAPAIASACLRKLAGVFDLTQYSTAQTVEDVDEVRRALGYEQINLFGSSFGTYAALMYVRMHGEHVRSAYLLSLITLNNRVPLYHADAAQWALDRLFDQCDADAACHSAYPALREDFSTVRTRLRQKPIRVSVHDARTGTTTYVVFTEPSFGDAVRVMMYSGERGRKLPFLIEQAKGGMFEEFAKVALEASSDLYATVRLGLYYSITCTEFVSRIRADEIGPATQGRYLGASRLEDQIASCKGWPKTTPPAGYFEPFVSEIPAVLISGDTDPITPPYWGEEVRSTLPNSIHVVVPGGHVPYSECTESIAEEMIRKASTRSLDVGCIEKLRATPFELHNRQEPRETGTTHGT